MHYDLIIKGSQVVTAADVSRADIGIRDGRVATLGHDLGSADRTLDATGLYALPGGIDSHVHIAQPSGPGVVMADDFESATRSAAFGGNTTVMPFCLAEQGQNLREAVDAYHAKASGNCHIDVSFHLIVNKVDAQTLGQHLPALLEAGHSSFKVFMTYPGMRLSDRQILDVMGVAKRHGAMVMVHAENEDAIEYLREDAEASGRTAPYHHALTRPVPVEREATHRAISLAEIAGVPLTIVHVSNGEALDEIRRARLRGVRVHAETCPQYLTLTAQDLDRSGFEGAKYVCSPPPRDEENQIACWAGLTQGEFELYSSDHCPFVFASEEGKKTDGAQRSFRHIPNGIPGVETRLPILFSEGVNKGRIELTRFAALTATNHAKLYGLYPRKGTIAVGSDADIVLWDPNRREVISQDRLHHGSDYTPWEGFEITGWPVITILRGKVIVENDELSDTSPHGQHLERGLPGLPI
jgi:dihydropyrimidinase